MSEEKISCSLQEEEEKKEEEMQDAEGAAGAAQEVEEELPPAEQVQGANEDTHHAVPAAPPSLAWVLAQVTTEQNGESASVVATEAAVAADAQEQVASKDPPGKVLPEIALDSNNQPREGNSVATTSSMRQPQQRKISRTILFIFVLTTLIIGVAVGVILGVTMGRQGQSDEDNIPQRKPTDDSPTDENHGASPNNNDNSNNSIPQKLGQNLYPDNAELEYFGQGLALSANGTILASGGGGPGFDDYGQVRVFKYNGDRWIPMGQTLVAEKAETRLDQQAFGYEVALSESGTTLAVRQGNEETSDLSVGSGMVSVFEYDLVLDRWFQLGNSLRGLSRDDRFGAALSLSADGRTLAVGAFNGRYVQIFQFNDTDWSQMGQTLEENDGYPIDFGMAVALSADGSILAAGGPTYDPTGGLVYVYEYQSRIDAWVQLGDFLQGQGVFNFGASIAISADGFMVAGVGGSSCMMEENCHVRVFRYNPSLEAWLELPNVLAALNPQSSVAMAKDGTVLAFRGTDFVALFRYQGTTSSWEQIGRKIEIDEIAFGGSLALSEDGSVLAVGSPSSANPVRVYTVRGVDKQ